MYRVEIGKLVRERLRGTNGAMQVPTPSLDIFIKRGFLDPSECETLISLIDANCKPSRLMAAGADPSFRTSETCNLDPRDGTVRAVERKFTNLLGIDPSHGEFLQGQRYAIGQEFKPHHDFLRTDSDYWPRQEKVGGQRTWTAMVFLNIPERGGETYFTMLDLRIPPRVGSIVAWNNLDKDGEPNPYSIHQGTPVLEGVKYIITKWYRERPWGSRREN